MLYLVYYSSLCVLCFCKFLILFGIRKIKRLKKSDGFFLSIHIRNKHA